MQSIRVLIAEDETMMRRLLARRLAGENGLQVVGEADNGRQAVEMALQLRPDVVVMDLQMPQMNGAVATERLTSELPETRVVILTSLDELTSVAKLSGAFECLDKGCTPEELVATIRRAHAAKRPAATPAAAVDSHRTSIERLSVRGNLTERERGVLEKVVGTELTIRQIAHALSTEWNETVTDSSVKHALERVMTKLHIEPRTRAALVKRVLEFDSSR